MATLSDEKLKEIRARSSKALGIINVLRENTQEGILCYRQDVSDLLAANDALAAEIANLRKAHGLVWEEARQLRVKRDELASKLKIATEALQKYAGGHWDDGGAEARAALKAVEESKGGPADGK